MQFSEKKLQAYRIELLNRLLWLAAILGSIRILLEVRHIEDLMSLKAFLQLILIGIAYAKNINFKIRASILLLIAFLASIISLTNFGVFGASRLLGMALVLLAAILFGVRAGMYALLLYTFTILITGWLIIQGVIEVNPLAQEISLRTDYWIQSFFTFFLITSVILYSVMYFIRNLNQQSEQLRIEVEKKDTALKAEQESKETFRILAENVHDVIWTMNLDGEMTYISPSVELVRGYTPEEALEGGLTLSGPPENLQILASEIQKALALEETGEADLNRWETFAVKLYHKDGSTLDTEIGMSFLRDENQKPVGILGVTRDVTERKKLESQLQQAQKMESIGQLAGGIAHDFNNLLMVILGYADLSAKSVDISSIHEYMGEVQNAAQRGAQMTKQLLAFSRRQIMELEPVNVANLIADLNKMIRSIIPANVNVEIKILDKPLYVMADYGPLEQVLTNLILNSRDAMPEGGTLEIGLAYEKFDEDFVRTHTWAKEGEFTVIRVTDTGHGMTPEEMEHIFEPFFSTKLEGKGTGLGLAMAFGTVEQLNGFIHVYSEKDKGSEFKIYLPNLADSGGDDSLETNHVQLTGTETILIVEDEEQVRDLGCIILREAGYTVIEAVDGVAGLEIYNKRKDEIDLILLDVVMPGMGGQEVLRAIRDNGDDIPILFTSGYSESAIHTDFILKEELSLIAKPYGPDQLKRKIRDVLDH